ncbi:MAG: hypothetical protein FD159_488 [Syntrophaceae bacterium]|nr:MAG: hypothetical protein FD159_488 [Syntrophaceae bacterium]
MANATDNLEQAEKIVNGIVYGHIEKDRALNICRWLMSFNSQEKGFSVKCYQTNVPDIRFCVDRGSDCEGKKIRTVFVTIRSNLQILFHTKNTDFTYLKQDQNDIYYIIPEAGKKLDMARIKFHILEAYCQKIDQLKLNSSMCIGTKITETIETNDTAINYYTFQKEDFEKAYRTIAKKNQSVFIDAVLDQLELGAKTLGHKLKNNWRLETERNIAIWSKMK